MENTDQSADKLPEGERGMGCFPARRPARVILAALISAALLLAVGCRTERSKPHFYPLADCSATGLAIEYPDLDACLEVRPPEEPPPAGMAVEGPKDYWDLGLEEALRIALTNSKVLADLGGTVVRAPDLTRTVYEPAMQETDPRYGVEAALSAFDAEFSTSAFFEGNDRALNNQFFGGGTRILVQDAAVFQAQLSKRTATGAQIALRKYIEYDSNNAPGNAYPSVWNVNPEFEVRVPLLQGAGAEFNRIAGPSQTPGLYGGVLIARVNTDISLADFEKSVRDYVSNVENAYWDLYFAYRDLDSKIAARDAALETWRRIRALYEAERRGGEAEKEAQAREQYFRFQEDVQDALTGRLVEGTQTYNGSQPGTFRGSGGVHVSERRLRLLMGVAINDGRLIRPVDEPAVAPVRFDWNQVVSEALQRRPELRQQKWRIKLRQLEYTASRNFLLPQLDVVGRYRWRGLGQTLINPDSGDLPPFDNAFQTLMSGDFQEWQLGVEMTVPIGHRRAYVAMRHAELNLARERTLLKEQQRQILHDLSNGVAEVERAEAGTRISFNRHVAASQQLAAVQAAYDADKAPLDQVLDAQRRMADAESRHHRARVEQAVAVKNVHFEKGTLLDYHQVYLAEGGWPRIAYHHAAEREALEVRPLLDYRLRRPLTVAAPVRNTPAASASQAPAPAGPAEFPLPAGEVQRLGGEQNHPRPLPAVSSTSAVVPLPAVELQTIQPASYLSPQGTLFEAHRLQF